jgi:hypothetical protein
MPICPSSKHGSSHESTHVLVQEVFKGLQQLKQAGTQFQAQLAEAQPQHAKQAQQQQQQHGAAGLARQGLPLEERCHFQQLEEKQLRAEIATLNSKASRSGFCLAQQGRAGA